MLLRRTKTLLVFLLVTCFAQAQVVVSGAVKDSLGKPLQAVSVTLKKTNGIILSFSITNASGAYKLQHASASIKDTLFVEANGIGFKKQSIEITSAAQVTDFKLSESSTKLPNVTVKAPPLRKEGDTLNYDVASFSTKQDRTIGDVIKKLPGVEVSENGQISYEGKPINRFYIDGDNLLDGKYNIATKGIPNDMVAKVQVLENHQPINVLKDLVKSDNAAMNLVLKEKARLKIMGTGDAALGSPGVYNVSANAMLFKKQVKFINYIKMNNVGVDLADETINHFGGSNGPVAPSLVSAGGPGNPDLLKKRYLLNNAGLINANDLVTLKKDVQLRINAFYSWDRIYQTSQYKSTYFLPNDTIRYAENQNARTTNNTFNTQFTLNVNRKDYYLNNVTVLENTPAAVLSDVQATSNNNITQSLNGVVTNISNRFNLIKKTTGGKFLEAYSFLNKINNPATLRVQPGLYPVEFNNSVPYYGLSQYAAVPSFFTEEYVSFGKASPRFQQQYRIGFNYLDQDLNSELNAQQLNGSKNVVADSFINRLGYSRLKVYVQTDFTYTTSRLMLRLTLPFTYQDTRYNGRIVHNQSTDIPITPGVMFKYSVGREAYFNLTYNYGNTFGGISSVYDSYIMRNYRNFYTNGNLLNQMKSHSVSGGYVFKNTLKIFFFSLGAGYNLSSSNTISDAQISPVLQQSKFIPFENDTRSYQLSAAISKYIFPLMTTVSGKANWQESISNQLQNGLLLQTKFDSYTYAVGLNTKFASWMNMSYNGTYNTYGSKPTGVTHTTRPASPKVERWQHELVANFNITQDFYFRVNGDNYQYHVPGSQDNNFTFVDAAFTYKFNKLKTDLELSLTNLGGSDTYSTASLSTNSIVESTYRIRPRMAMVKFYFRF
jgi:hypothetical protein